MDNKHLKRCSTSVSIGGNANQNHNELSPHACQKDSSKSIQIKNVGEDMEKRELSYTVCRNVNCCSHCAKTVYRLIQKLKTPI